MVEVAPPPLAAVRLHVTDAAPPALGAARAAFPTVRFEVAAGAPPPGAIALAAWRAAGFDAWGFDRAADRAAAAGAPLALVGPGAALGRLALEVVTRAQRLVARTNAASAAPWFARAVARHRARHDVARPLVRADLDHALDCWQWLLRLDGGAGAAVQLAALLHDVERLVTEADARIEHRAADYQAFKDAHARAGAALARALLAGAGVPAAVAARAAALIARHERPGDDPELALLNDADGLSFFSLNSPGYVAYFGAARAHAKVAWTLARMSPRARAALGGVRLGDDVRAWVRAWHDEAAHRAAP